MDPHVTEVFDRHINAALGRIVEFGVSDCLPFAAGIIRDLTGIDIIGNTYRGRWNSEEEGMALIPLGMGTTMARRMRDLGWRRVPVEQATPGALCLLRLFVAGPEGMREIHEAGVFDGYWVIHRIEMGVGNAPISAVRWCWVPPCQ
jgi:hypothetical protein